MIEYVIPFYAFVFGTIIGSFLNVVLYRMHTGRSLTGRSHCMSCGHILSWYELFPLISYIIQRGACRKCHAYIPSRYFIVELGTGIAFLAIALWDIPSPLLSAWWYVVAVFLILIVVYDVRHTIIPDEFTAALGICALGYVALVLGTGAPLAMTILNAIGGATVTAFFFWLLWHVSQGRWIGFGDVKLSGVLGCIVGLTHTMSFIIWSFWIGAFISVALIGIQHARAWWTTRLHFSLPTLTMKSEVPFAPFLIAGFIMVHLCNVSIFSITTFLSEWIIAVPTFFGILTP